MLKLHDLLDRRASGYGPPPELFERVLDRRRRRDRNRRVGTAVVALAIAAVALGGLFRAISPNSVPASDPQNPFAGTWISTSDTDGGTQTMIVEVFADGVVEIVVTDNIAAECTGTASTMTGTGRIEDGRRLVIPEPVYTCDDGTEPQTLSGPPLEEQLRDWTLILAAETDRLSDGAGGVWRREGAEVPSPEPTITGQMWPQSTYDEVRAAQELADAGDPRYTWQVDPMLGGGAAPWGAEIFDRFFREELGWEEFSNLWGYATGGGGGHELYTELMFIRCAPGRTNPLSDVYPEMPSEVRRCAPTIDDFRYETVMLTVEQPVRRSPSGIWVVTGWELVQHAEPGSLYGYLSSDFTGRQVEQLAPPSDAEVTALLQGFLGARVDGEGAEEYLLPHDEAEWPPWLGGEVPLLYATTGGTPYERSEIERVQGPVWPTGWFEFRVRLFAEDGTVVEQSFVLVRQENGRLGLVYGSQSAGSTTTENGQAVPVPYSLLDGEVTFAAASPWGVERGEDPTFTTLTGGTCKGTGWCSDNFVVVADPLMVKTGCEAGPARPDADAEALARSIRSNPDLEATAPVTVSVGGVDALRMDVIAAPGASVCEEPLMMAEHVGLLRTDRMRLYLLDLPGGSARILAIAMIARDPYGEVEVPQQDFEHVVEAATPIMDSFEFHTR